MVEPINMQILVTNIDEVAKSKNVHEHGLLAQQSNARKDEAKEIERKNTTVIETAQIDKKKVSNDNNEKSNREKRYVLKNKKEQEDKEKKEEHKKPKEPNKGGILDIEI